MIPVSLFIFILTMGSLTSTNSQQMERSDIPKACFETNPTTIHQLLDACMDNNPLTIARNTKKLQQFPKADFDNNAKKKIANLLLKKPPHLDRFFKLAGFLNMEEELRPFLQQKIKNRQALKLALVRTGDQAMLENLLKNVRKIPVGDDFIFGLMPELIYARQKPITDFLMEIILSNDKNCTPADAETPGNIICAYRIIEALAPVVIDFPVQVDDFGDIITKDYPKALKSVRAWIKSHKSDYQLNTEIY